MAQAHVQQTTEMFERFGAKAVEGLTLWAETNQKVLRQLADLSAAAAGESVRVYSELQSSAVQAARSTQDLLITQQARLQGLPTDPVGSYQKGVLDSVEGAQRAFKLLESSAETVTKSAERLQESAEKVSREIQGTFSSLAAGLKALYAPADAK